MKGFDAQRRLDDFIQPHDDGKEGFVHIADMQAAGPNGTDRG